MGVIWHYRYTYTLYPWIIKMKIRFSRLFIIILAGLLLGCGNTGDLYLPEDTAETFSNDTKIQET